MASGSEKKKQSKIVMQHTEVSASVCYCFDFICVFSPVIFKKLKCVFTIVINIVLARQSDFSSLAGWSVSKDNIKPPQLKRISQQKICATCGNLVTQLKRTKLSCICQKERLSALNQTDPPYCQPSPLFFQQFHLFWRL